MSTRVTVPVIIGNRCILMIGAFIDPFLNRFAFSKCQSLPIPQNQRIFPSNSRKPKSLPVIIGNHCILMIGAFIDPFLNRFAFSKCRSLPILPNQRIFPSNSRKPKSLPEIICGWVSTIFSFAETLEIPQNLTQNILGDVKSLGPLRECAQLFSTISSRNELDEFALWSRYQDCWFLFSV